MQSIHAEELSGVCAELTGSPYAVTRNRSKSLFSKWVLTTTTAVLSSLGFNAAGVPNDTPGRQAAGTVLWDVFPYTERDVPVRGVAMVDVFTVNVTKKGYRRGLLAILP